MQKIPTIFLRDVTTNFSRVLNEWNPQCLWVRDGEGIATRKYDGTCCLIRNGVLYKRRELREGDIAPDSFESVSIDLDTGKTVGWVPVGSYSEDRWHREAIKDSVLSDGTYELVGPKVNGSKDGFTSHTLIPHARARLFVRAPRDFQSLPIWFETEEGAVIEGLVWHHPDGRMAKIKRRDFGLVW